MPGHAGTKLHKIRIRTGHDELAEHPVTQVFFGTLPETLRLFGGVDARQTYFVRLVGSIEQGVKGSRGATPGHVPFGAHCRAGEAGWQSAESHSAPAIERLSGQEGS